MDADDMDELKRLLIKINDALQDFGAKCAAVEGSVVMLIAHLADRGSLDADQYVNELRRIGVHQEDFEVRDHQQRIAMDVEESVRLLRESRGGG